MKSIIIKQDVIDLSIVVRYPGWDITIFNQFPESKHFFSPVFDPRNFFGHFFCDFIEITVKFLAVDFEGEPGLPLAERRVAQPVARDVADREVEGQATVREHRRVLQAELGGAVEQPRDL